MQHTVQSTRTIQIQGKTWTSDSVPPKPQPPKAFFKATSWDLCRSICSMLCLWSIPALISLGVYYTNIPLPCKIAVYCIMAWLSGNGIVFAEWIGHDGVHGGLLPNNRKLGMLIGLMISPAILGFMNIGFAARHLEHHRYTNQESDYDTTHYSKYQGILGRLFLSRIHKNFVYMYAAYLTFQGDSKHVLLGYTLRETRRLVIVNVVFALLWIGLYTMIAVYNLPLFVFFVVLPMIALILSTGSVTYQQHGGTGDTDPTDHWRNTRSMTSPFWTFLYGGGNFHLEHHLYPSVPFFNLPKVHQYLEEQGYFQLSGLHLDDSHISGYKYFSSNYPYPNPTSS